MTPLETCLGISGQFEGGNGGPRWDLLTGNFDQMGISVGCLQWNPGTGSAQELLARTARKMAQEDQDKFTPILHLKDLNSTQGTDYAVRSWINPATAKVTPEAKIIWSEFLRTPECIAAQKELAQIKVDKSLVEAQKFMPFLPEIDLRTLAFFFDIRVQQGSITKVIDKKLWAPVILQDPGQADWRRAVTMAHGRGKKDTAKAWEGVAANDPLAAALLHYAFERASKARTPYIWDALSRRGTIACRRGGVHGVWFDFTQSLP